jgi:hypothetical protein
VKLHPEKREGRSPRDFTHKRETTKMRIKFINLMREIKKYSRRVENSFKMGTNILIKREQYCDGSEQRPAAGHYDEGAKTPGIINSEFIDWS